MSAERIVRDFLGAAEKDAVKASAYLTDDFTFCSPLPVPLNKSQWIELQALLLKAIPDWTFHLSEVQENNGHVTLRGAVTGTHTDVLNPLMPGMPAIAPTGKSIALPADKLDFTLRGDVIADLNVETSPDGGVPGILQQIGAPIPN